MRDKGKGDWNENCGFGWIYWLAKQKRDNEVTRRIQETLFWECARCESGTLGAVVTSHFFCDSLRRVLLTDRLQPTGREEKERKEWARCRVST